MHIYIHVHATLTNVLIESREHLFISDAQLLVVAVHRWPPLQLIQAMPIQCNPVCCLDRNQCCDVSASAHSLFASALPLP